MQRFFLISILNVSIFCQAQNFSAKGVAMRDVLFQNTRATVYDKPTEASQLNQSKRLEGFSAYKESMST